MGHGTCVDVREQLSEAHSFVHLASATMHTAGSLALRLLCDSNVSVSHFTWGMLGLQTGATVHSICKDTGSDSNSGRQACMTGSLTC